MRMAHFIADDDYRYPFAGHGFFHGMGYFFGKKPQSGVQFILHIKNVVNLLLGNAQRVAFGLRAHIQKCEVICRFGNFVAGDFPVDNASENAWHGVQGIELVIGYQLSVIRLVMLGHLF